MTVFFEPYCNTPPEIKSWLSINIGGQISNLQALLKESRTYPLDKDDAYENLNKMEFQLQPEMGCAGFHLYWRNNIGLVKYTWAFVSETL